MSAPTFVSAVSYTLQVSTTGSGIVTSNPAGISCGGDCSEDYAENTVVTLTANSRCGLAAR